MATLLVPLRATTLDEIAANFERPPASARSWVWWHWMNGHVSESGITKDLEALAEVGVGGVVLFEEANHVPPGPVQYLSEDHWRLIGHAAREARRLGLGFDFHNCPGWSSSGGPWIKPEDAMKHLTWSEANITGGRSIEVSLPRPPTVVEPYSYLPHPGRYEYHDYYRDVTVIAFPTPEDPGWRLPDWESRAGFKAAYGLRDFGGAVPDGVPIRREDLVDLSDRMDADGVLRWEAPPGHWTIVRLGYTLTGHVNRAAPSTGIGLECDKLSRSGVDAHWNGFLEKVLEVTGTAGERPIHSMLIDSYETLTQTWTPLMPAEFKRLRGYELAPFLPALMGRVVEDLATTEKFLWDYRRTLADLAAEHYYGYFAEKCHELGIVLSGEAYGRYGTFFDDFQVNTKLDIPMGEFWGGAFQFHHWSGKVAASAADLTGRHVVGAEAYTSGGNNAAWHWHPYLMKAQGDSFYCRGVNRFYIQASVHQPWDDSIKPGMTFGPHGMQMHRNNTWWLQSRAWLEYQSRCQYVLQHGQLVTDTLVYLGEGAPSTFWANPEIDKDEPAWDPDIDPTPDYWLGLAPGRDFHVGNADIVRQLDVAPDGQIALPDGQRYHALVLADDIRMRPDILERIEKLAEGGALVIGPQPLKSPSLQDGPDADAIVRNRAEALWESGKVRTSGSIGSLLAERGIPPDFEYRRPPGSSASRSGREPKLDYIHRRVDDGEFYFVANMRSERAQVECVFRVKGDVTAEWWQPETGAREAILQGRRLSDGRLALVIDFDPAGSGFVVFRPAAQPFPWIETFERDGQAGVSNAGSRLSMNGGHLSVTAFRRGEYNVRSGAEVLSARVEAIPPALDLSADWSLEFPGGAAQAMARLQPWIAFADDRRKFFSGTATYRKEFTLGPGSLAAGIVAELDLGEVADIAEITVNGRDLGILWKPPFRADVTSVLRPGLNEIMVRVTNRWRNRLIGDARLRNFGPGETRGQRSREFLEIPDWVVRGEHDPDPRVTTFSLNSYLNNSHEPDASGLLGPVRIEWGRTAAFQ